MGVKGAKSGVCRDTVRGLGVVGSGDVVRGSGSIGLEKIVGDIGDEGARDEGNKGMGVGAIVAPTLVNLTTASL